MHSALEEEIFIKIPPSYDKYLKEISESVAGKFMKVEKSTYSLVQAARSWWKKFTTVLKEKLRFQQYEYDSCLLKRVDQEGRLFLIIYVDDCFVVGNQHAVKKALEYITLRFNITCSKNFEDVIGCTVERDGNAILRLQADLIMKMIKNFKDKIEISRHYETPAPTASHII